MGCDIHVFVERHNNETNEWESINLYKKEEDGGFEAVDVYDGRDYELFGLLAGVRGGHFPFCGGYGYLVYPRGLPENLSAEVKEKWGDGDYWHTPTWYDFCELDTYSYLLSDFSNALKAKNKRIAELENENELLKNQSEDATDYIEEEWDWYCEEDYSGINSLKEFVNDIRNVLNKYRIYRCDPGEIRVVMWFDN